MLNDVAIWVLALSLATLVYIYIGYPALLWLLTVVRRGEAVAIQPDDLPSLELFISAFDEAEVIEAKLRNCCSLDYPVDLLKITVISDASEDGTDDLVLAFPDDRVNLLRMEGRGGKTAGLNAAVALSQAEVLVFSDANAMYSPDALRILVGRLQDQSVGAAVGRSSYVDDPNVASQSETTYWDYEVWMKCRESQLGSVVGGDGAIYATRRSLFTELPVDAISDFQHPLQLVAEGHRVVYEPTAVCTEQAAGSFDREYRRKVRIVNRSFRAVLSVPNLLNPLRFGIFSICLWSHKVLRWFAGLFMILAFLSNLVLVGQNLLITVVFCLQLGFWGMAGVGWLMRKRGNLPMIVMAPYYLVLVNIAGLDGIWKAMTGTKFTTWATPRDATT